MDSSFFFGDTLYNGNETKNRKTATVRQYRDNFGPLNSYKQDLSLPNP
jgi:hypothetical protein